MDGHEQVENVITGRWVRLQSNGQTITTRYPTIGDWQWLRDYLQLDLDLQTIYDGFPADVRIPLRAVRVMVYAC